MSAINIEMRIKELVDTVKIANWVRAIGMSGAERPFPKPGEGDIDLFIYCSEIPAMSQRNELLAVLRKSLEPLEIGRLENDHWGLGDSCQIAGVEVWLLYFTVAEASAELKDILSGKYLWRVDNYYYPLGRCAMWKTMRVYYDPDRVLQSFKTRLAEYPSKLAKMVIDHHLAALDDVEDLERAVRRCDVFFYHFALDLALDHFLQTLFALNKTYFPSRKRSEQYMQEFRFKPLDCEQRLRRVIAQGADACALGESYAIWQGLVRELQQLANTRGMGMSR